MGDSVNSRQRLKPWLESKIESGMIPGLCWLDRNQKIFRIPWKRNGTSEWAKEDSAIFRDWAVHTGKFREGIDKIDYPYWKTRLRCALNKHQEITEHKDLINQDGNDPYRVYQILDNTTRDEPLPTQENDMEMVDDFASPMNMEIDLRIWNSNLQNTHNTKEVFHIPEDMLTSVSMDSDLKKISTSDLLPLSSEEFRKLQHDFEVIIRFQSEQVRNILVKECCFLTKNYIEERTNDYQVILFPDIVPMTKEVHDITSVLWPNLKDGIYIKVDENKNILAQRLCKCRIYYRNQNNLNGLKLDRSDGKSWTIIFNYQDFLRDFRKGEQPIQADVTLYIGQRGDPNPYNFGTVFLSVTICHLQAKEYLTDRNIKVHKVSMSI